MTTDQQHARIAGKNARRQLSNAQRDKYSDAIADRVIRAAWFQRASYVGCYLPTIDEVNTWEIIARAWLMGKRVFVPVVEKKQKMQFRELTPETDLRPASWGLLEPSDGEIASARMLDVVITPVVAFDKDNHRIGMGGGYFDRTFAFLRHRSNWRRPRLIGLAFDCQQVEKIRPNPWDIRVFTIVTEKNR